MCREKMIKERKRTAALRVEWFGSPEDLAAFCHTEQWRENPAFTCFRGSCQRNKGFRYFPSSLIKPSSVHKWDPLLFNKKRINLINE